MGRGDITGRWDANSLFNKTDFSTFRYGPISFDELCADIFQGVTIKPAGPDDEVGALRVKDITLAGQIILTNAELTSGVPERKELQDGDVLTPFIGEAIRQHKVALFTTATGRFTVDGNIGVLRPNRNLVDPAFLTALLGSSLVTRQIKQLIGGGGVPFLGSGNARQLIGTRPSLDIQRRLVAELDAARAERDRALAEADDLLSSLDPFVLNALSINPDDEQRCLFAVRLRDIRQRLDADYHSPRFQRLRRAIELSAFPVERLADLAVFMRSGFAAGRQDQAWGDDAGLPHLRPLNLNAWGELSIIETKRVPAHSVAESDFIARGEVLFNNTNSAEWVGKSAVFDLEEACACSNHMTRIQLKAGNDPYFLAALLNAFRGIGYFSALSTFFNNQAGINTATLGSMRIPVPELATQQSIAATIRKRKQQASSLRTHAETVWQQARERFEQQLLQGGDA